MMEILVFHRSVKEIVDAWTGPCGVGFVGNLFEHVADQFEYVVGQFEHVADQFHFFRCVL